MGDIADRFGIIYRDHEVDGLPASGSHDPEKGQIRFIGNLIDNALSLLGSAVTVGSAVAVYATRSSLNSNLSAPDRSIGIVYNDGTNNGVYVKVGAVGTGSWNATGLMLAGRQGDQGPEGKSIYDVAIATGAVPPGTTPDQFVQQFIGQLVTNATTTLNAQVAAAKQSADLAADSAGIDRTYATKAAATGYANGDIVQIIKDESQGGARSMYRAENGGLTFLAKIASVNTDLSNVTIGATTPGELRVGGNVPNSPYFGGVDAVLRAAGLIAAAKTTNGGEHRLINFWNANNSASLQNLSNNDGYSAWRFLDYQGREAAAVGYGNPGGSADLYFRGRAYFESNNFINADGSSTPGPIRPYGVVQTGLMPRRDGSTAMGVYVRYEVDERGDFNYYSLAPVWSEQQNLKIITFSAQAGFYSAYFRDIDNRSNILRIRSKNGYEAPGVIIGDTYEPTNGAPPQVALDVGGNGVLVSGAAKDSGRSQDIGLGGASPTPFGHVIYQNSAYVARWLRQTVAKADWRIQGAANGLPARLELYAADGNKTSIWFALDNSGSVGVGGRVGFNGTAPIAPPTLPATLPTDGSATSAQMATAINSVMAALRSYGLAM